jgi:diacylglycerol kinase (ATP)
MFYPHPPKKGRLKNLCEMTNLEKQWVFIINPIAGNGFAKSVVPKLREMIKKHNIAAELVYSERSGHATELSEKYLKKGFSYFIGVGGDGTVNEIARPLVNRKGVTIGIIPAGTGNDFIQILGFPNRFADADWDIFFKCKEIAMDAGYVNGMIFLNGMGLGFDAQVAAENYTEPGKVKKGGRHKYIWHIVKTLLFFREKRMTVITETGRNDTDCFINTIAIGRRFAGGFLLTPKAIANDGLLDVCMIKKLSLIERFNILLKVPEGKHITDKRVNYYQTPGIVLEFSEELPFHVDGELNFSKKFDVRIIPGALNTIYNPDGKHFFTR